MNTLNTLAEELRRRHPAKPISQREFATLVRGFVERFDQLEAKIDSQNQPTQPPADPDPKDNGQVPQEPANKNARRGRNKLGPNR